MQKQFEKSHTAIQYLEHMVLNTVSSIEGHFKQIEIKIQELNNALDTCRSIIEEDRYEQGQKT